MIELLILLFIFFYIFGMLYSTVEHKPKGVIDKI